MDHSTLKDNASAGAMLGSDNTLSYDCLADNQQYGFNAYSPNGPVDLVLKNNEIAGNDTYNWEAHACRDAAAPVAGSSGTSRARSSRITGYTTITASGCGPTPNNRGFEIRNNYISDNYDYGLIYEISYNAVIKQNTFVRNGLGSGPKSPGSRSARSISRNRVRTAACRETTAATFLIAKNRLSITGAASSSGRTPNRFCDSPANTSSGTCTLVAPSVATHQVL